MSTGAGLGLSHRNKGRLTAAPICQSQGSNTLSQIAIATISKVMELSFSIIKIEL